MGAGLGPRRTDDASSSNPTDDAVEGACFVSEPPLAHLGAALGSALAAPVSSGLANEGGDDALRRSKKIQPRQWDHFFFFVTTLNGLVLTVFRGVGALVAFVISLVLQISFVIERVMGYFLSWLPEASDATLLLMFMVFTWSTASQLLRGGFESGAFAGSGIAGPGEVEEKTTAETVHVEISNDVLAPIVGIIGGFFGVQRALGLSLAVPIFVLVISSLQHYARFVNSSFDEHSASQQLGGLFGQPLLIAQIIVLRLERKGSSCKDSRFGDCRVVALGCLVGAYALGVVVGSISRRLAHIYLVAIPNARVFGGCFIIFLDLILLKRYSKLLGGVDDAPSINGEESIGSSDVLERHRCVIGLEQLFSQFKEGLSQIMAFTNRLVMIGSLCVDLFTARFLFVLAFTISVGSESWVVVDIFHHPPFRHGLRVSLFSLVGAICGGGILPVIAGQRVCCSRRECLHLAGGFAITISFTALFTSLKAPVSAFPSNMYACIALSILAATSNLVLAVEAIERVKSFRRLTAGLEATYSEEDGLLDDQGQRHRRGRHTTVHHCCNDDVIVLGLWFLVTSMPQNFGTRIGSYVHERYSRFGVAMLAWIACGAGLRTIPSFLERNRCVV